VPSEHGSRIQSQKELELEIICKVCDKGLLGKKKKYRMSGPVVAIGYILLIPSVLGIAFSLLMLVMTTASRGGVGLAEGIIIFVALGFLVMGLLGWLLVMKKQVLQCSICGAVVNAT
jgi:hypothetical protein